MNQITWSKLEALEKKLYNPDFASALPLKETLDFILRAAEEGSNSSISVLLSMGMVCNAISKEIKSILEEDLLQKGG